MEETLRRAALAIRRAKALVLTTGAGMGVDSGLPDFRGAEGFWKAYPPLRERGLTLPQVSTPHWFLDDPHFAWWFYGHRIDLYRGTQPHRGHEILLRWAQRGEYFAFTSNVDRQLQRAGFDEERLVECHGSLFHLQCVDPDTAACDQIWPVSEEFHLEYDLETLRAKAPLHRGPPSWPAERQLLARPNVLMFSDWQWISRRTDLQEQRLNRFLHKIHSSSDPFVVIEIGTFSWRTKLLYNSSRFNFNYS